MDKIKKLIQENSWIFAKTMPENPHEYTLRKKWLSDDEFDYFVAYIRENGYKQKFGKVTYIYLNVDGYCYWSMGAPIEKTILINRAKIQ